MEEHIFQKGQRYKVRRKFTSSRWDFAEGEILTCVGEGFSPYDNCYIGDFVSQKDSKQKAWLNPPIHDLWMKYLEPIRKSG